MKSRSEVSEGASGGITMRHSMKRAFVARGAAFMSVTALLLISGGERTHASGIHEQVPGGTTATLGLRVPLGGKGPTESQSMLALRFGSSWRDAPGSLDVSGYRFVPAMEAGITFGGEPVFKLGAFDIVASANAEGGEPERRYFCAENAAVCLIGGALAIGGVVWAVSAVNRGDNGPCNNGNGCD